LSVVDAQTAPVVVCSLGDASCTEGEVSEAFQMAAFADYGFTSWLPSAVRIADYGLQITNCSKINTFLLFQKFNTNKISYGKEIWK